MKPYNSLPGIYGVVLLTLEPLATVLPAVLTVFVPGGGAWFYNQLVPGGPLQYLDGPHTRVTFGQLVNAFGVIGAQSALTLRAVRWALPNDPVAQERIVGMYIGILACGDIPHILLTILSFPSEIAANPLSWNATAYGNIVGTACLFALRMAWFAGIGRQAAAPLTKDK